MPLHLTAQETQLLANNNMAPNRSPNINYLWKALTSSQIEELTGGRIKRLTKNQAAGLIANWVVETGSPDLSQLDVEEIDGGAGRGMSQYTGARRGPYDYARLRSKDPNSVEFQLAHFAKEYIGVYDKMGGGSLSGYRRTFEDRPSTGSPGDYARYFSNSYFRPGIPNNHHRVQAAQEIFSVYSQPEEMAPPPTPSTPEPTAGQLLPKPIRNLTTQGM